MVVTFQVRLFEARHPYLLGLGLLRHCTMSIVAAHVA